MTDIKLTLINKSNDVNNSEIVIFQKNVATDFEELAVAWQVVKNLGQGWSHSFTYPATWAAGASDNDGNQSPLKAVKPGQQLNVVQTPHGHDLVMGSPATAPQEIGISNQLPQGAINAGIYKNRKLLAVKTTVAPGQKAVFAFKPTIFIGVVSEVAEGDVMDSAVISDINTEISLLGIASADIVMTGGGTGPDAVPFAFNLENVQMA